MDIIFNLFKIKFKLLEQLIMVNCPNFKQTDKVNVFINLDPIFSKLATSHLDNEIQLTNEKKSGYLVISNIINIAAHYRLFFSKNNMYSRVFLYTTMPLNGHIKNMDINQEYRYPYLAKFNKNPSNYLLSRLITDNFKSATIILEYIKGVYLIESHILENSLIPEIIMDGNDGFVNFIVTTDPYDFQYVNKGFNILRPKKDDSMLINKNNLWKSFGISTDINTIFYPFILSILGDKVRGLSKVKGIGFKKAIKMIEKGIKEKEITNLTANISSLISLIPDEYADLVLTNYMCTDIDAQKEVVHMSGKLDITNQLIDRFDNEGLKQICREYFNESPINIMELTDAYRLLKRGNGR